MTDEKPIRLRVGEDSGFFLSGALLAGWMDGLCAKKTD